MNELAHRERLRQTRIANPESLSILPEYPIAIGPVSNLRLNAERVAARRQVPPGYHCDLDRFASRVMEWSRLVKLEVRGLDIALQGAELGGCQRFSYSH